ncbi:efflux RND transporter periplasmic adaptor subunit [Caldimonas tepidiphila]|uniref:efflux RND transporter periplasmic adaptor subunit n=1 Tax=Caldimonas tepidiphila TaxID=2315841 RepID=UPI000E5A5EEA|nr:efflux RND transporter periplasmic adaptor subunit [Caldimonas tepidiphila]
MVHALDSVSDRSRTASRFPGTPGLRAAGGAIALAALLAVAACGQQQDAAAQGAAGGPGGAGGPPPAMPVAVQEVRQQAVPVTIEAVGQAEGSKEVEVRARVSGLIERQLYQEGERVKAGAPLFQIERAPFEIALAQARAALAQETARAEQARREAQRLAPLAQAQAISQREHDEAVATQRALEASLQAAQARVREAELNLSYTLVNAPIAGITGRAQKSQGSLVSPGSDSLLTTVSQTDPIWVRFSFSTEEQERLQRMDAAQRRQASVRLLDANGQPIPDAVGRLNFSGSTVDPRLGTVALRAEFPNPRLEILPGQFVRAQVVLGAQPAVLVPQAAVMQGEQGRMVWTVRDGKATPTPVQVGGWVGQDWAIRGGLKEGDQVIVNNLMKLRPGAPVAPQAAGAAGAPAGAASAPAAGASAPAPSTTASAAR